MRSGSEASVVDALVRDTRLNGAVAEAGALAARGSSVREAMLASPPRRALMVEAAPPPLPQPRAGANALEVVITVCATEALVDGTALKVVECAAEQLVDDAHAVVCSSAGALGLAGALRAELRARSCRMAQPLGKKRKLCVACLRPIVRASASSTSPRHSHDACALKCGLVWHPRCAPIGSIALRRVFACVECTR
ncbi:hypothetical protein KFE25_006437 [Diacronema lutheri]|uniref:Uncharacterized protein n=1 Tax=Diacronema lutheri TaxID=2081491 RepID=A0A8J5XWV6_DIALT|nr:hypothetical protein KFE25_006437 [Diacronema lutheri]